MTATARSALPGKLLTLGVVLAATLSVLAFMPVADADTVQYDGVHDLYGYKITMGLIEPDQVSSVEWDFGDGSEKVTVQITSENPVGSVQHTYAEKGDYVVTATMRNQYTNEAGDLVDGESKLTYLYHIHGYPVVTFDSNGGSEVAPIEGTASHYVPTKPADPVYEGHGFSGWYTDSECTKPFDWSTEVTQHTTLYAGWDITMFTVTFDYAGGTGTASDISVPSGGNVAAPEDPVKEGFQFDGWYSGDERFDFSSPVTDNITLTAHWKEASEPAQDDNDEGFPVWIVFAVIALLCVAAVILTGTLFIGIPAALFAVLSAISYLGVI